MKTSFTPDWIQATTKHHSVAQVVSQFCYGLSPEEWITAKAFNGYEHALKHPFGHVVAWTTKRDDMGINIMFTGLPLKEIHNAGHNTLAIINWLCEEDFKFSRIDLAIDARGTWFDLDKLQGAKFSGTVNKLPTLYKNGPNAEEGQTLYIGSQDSDKFVRIYDKGVMQIPPETNWFRFEIVFKGRTATKVSKMIFNLTDTEAGRFAQGAMKAMFNPEYPDYHEAINAEPVKVASTKDASHSTYDWLMASIAPVMARVILELPHREVLETFEKEVLKHIKELAAKSLSKTKDL